MKSTSTYNKIWGRYEELRLSYNHLIEEAQLDDSTVAQYAGSDRLAKLAGDIESLLNDCLKLRNYDDRRKAQTVIIELLLPVIEALSDACLYECDPAASFEDYVS